MRPRMLSRSHPLQACELSRQIAETLSLGCHAFSFLALGFLLRQLCSPLTSCSIGQASAFGAEQQRVRTFGVVQASLDPTPVNLLLGLAVVVSEIEFSAIALQVLRADMMESTDNAALEDGEKPFDGVGMRIAAHIFAAAMVDRFVAGEHRRENSVLAFPVGHEASLSGVNLRLQYWAQVGGVHGRQVLRTHFARLALNKRKDHFLTQSARSVLETLARMLVVLLPAYVGFVRLNSVAAPTKYAAVRLHGFSDAVGQEPRALDGHAKSALQLVRADAFLTGRNQKDGLQPNMHRDMAGLEYSPDLDGKRLAAVVALVRTYAGALAAHLADTLYTAAMRAYWTLRPDTRFYEGISRFFVVKVRGGKDGFGHGWLLNMVPV